MTGVSLYRGIAEHARLKGTPIVILSGLDVSEEMPRLFGENGELPLPAAVIGIVRSHSVGIRVASEPGKGTTVQVLLPEKTGSASEGVDVHERADQAGLHGKTVLLVDDEETVRRVGASMLGRLGCQVETASDGRAAVEIFAEDPSRFDCVILDLTIPGGMGGKETMKRLLDIDPNVKAVVSSGYSSDPIMADYRQYGFHAIVPKPYKVEELSQVLHDIISGQHKKTAIAAE